MTTTEVLRTSRAFFRQGRSASACSFGDWPEAVRVFNDANWWLRVWPWRVSRRATIRALDRAVALAAREEAMETPVSGRRVLKGGDVL